MVLFFVREFDAFFSIICFVSMFFLNRFIGNICICNYMYIYISIWVSLSLSVYIYNILIYTLIGACREEVNTLYYLVSESSLLVCSMSFLLG